MATQVRCADFGFRVGALPAGKRDAISDVPGVTVGHCTVDTPTHKTGVTVLLPCRDDPFENKLPAASFVLNGFGKTAGLVQIDELGTLETPIALTNTLNVGLVQDALVEYMVRRRPGLRSVNPVVAECNDGGLNDIAHRAVTARHVFAALEDARADFALGDVGAGKGMVCHGLKGGVGSASRLLEFDGVTYTLGALVLANHGRLEDLTVGGRRVGPDIAAKIAARGGQAAAPAPDRGSCIVIFATDLPLSSRQLGRVARRASVGLARLGSFIGHGSGEVFLAFSTANRVPHESDAAILPAACLHESRVDGVFRAAAETTEEAVLSAMLAADTVTGFDGSTKYTLRDFLAPRVTDGCI